MAGGSSSALELQRVHCPLLALHATKANNLLRRRARRRVTHGTPGRPAARGVTPTADSRDRRYSLSLNRLNILFEYISRYRYTIRSVCTHMYMY